MSTTHIKSQFVLWIRLQPCFSPRAARTPCTSSTLVAPGTGTGAPTHLTWLCSVPLFLQAELSSKGLPRSKPQAGGRSQELHAAGFIPTLVSAPGSVGHGASSTSTDRGSPQPGPPGSAPWHGGAPSTSPALLEPPSVPMVPAVPAPEPPAVPGLSHPWDTRGAVCGGAVRRLCR